MNWISRLRSPRTVASPEVCEAISSGSAIRKLIAKSVPGYGEIENIDQTRVEFQIDGRTRHTPLFPMPEGRAALHVIPANRLGQFEPRGARTLRLMTVRSEGQFNTVVYEEEDVYRGIGHRNVVLMHPDDIELGGLDCNLPFTVIGPAGTMTGLEGIKYSRIRPGNVLMYFPEANVLLDRTVDPKSRTPAFKGALVSVSQQPLESAVRIAETT